MAFGDIVREFDEIVKRETPPGWPGQIELHLYGQVRQDVVANQSRINCAMYVTTPAGWDIGPWTDFYGSYLGTEALTFSGSIPNFSGTQYLTTGKAFIVDHEADGTKNASILWKWGINSPTFGYANPSGAYSFALPTIARGGSLDAVSCSTPYFTGDLSCRYTPRSAGNYNRLIIYHNTGDDIHALQTLNLGQKSASPQTETLTLPADAIRSIYTQLPTATSGTLRFGLRTYSDPNYAVQIGDEAYKELTLSIPEDVKPACAADWVSVAPDNVGTAFDETGLYVIRYSRVQAFFNASKISTEASGSPVDHYSISLNGAPPVTSTPYMTDKIISESASVTVSVVDQRGRSVSGTHEITAYPYSPPTLSGISVFRCDANGEAQNGGPYIYLKVKVNYSGVNGLNAATISGSLAENGENPESVFLIPDDEATLLGGALAEDVSYVVRIVATDNFSKSDTHTAVLSGKSAAFHLRDGGLGAAFGKYAETDGLLDVAWSIRTAGKFDAAGSIKTDGNVIINGQGKGLMIGGAVLTETDLNALLNLI